MTDVLHVRSQRPILRKLAPFAALLGAIAISSGDLAADPISPKGTVSSGTIEFRWGAEARATEFLWRVLQNGQPIKASKEGASGLGCGKGGTCSLTRGGFGDGSYQWQVRPFYSGRKGDWSDTASFQVGSTGSGGGGEPPSDGGDGSSGGGGGTNDRTPFDRNSLSAPLFGSYKTSTEVMEARVRTPTRIQQTFIGRKSGWKALDGIGDFYKSIAADDNNPKRMWSITYPLMPDGITNAWPQGTANLPRCASGEFNDHYRKFALAMKGLGVSSVIIRPGWEWSLKIWPWGTRNDVDLARDYAECFRQFVDTVQAHYPDNNFLYDWNPQADTTRESMAAGWPGNKYVDFVGIDIYDNYWGPDSCANDPECRWNDRMKKFLAKIKSFADSKNKAISIPEFGISKGFDLR